MIKIKKGFLLRSLGDEQIAVAVGEASKAFNGMIRLNKTGALYWKELEKGTTEDALAEKTLEQFDGADADTVRRDIKEFLESIRPALEYDETDN